MNQNILGDKKKSSFDDNLADYVNKLFENQPDVVIPKKKVSVTSDFYVEEQQHGYVLKCVPLRDEILTVGWSKDLLDDGKAHDLDRWNEFTKTKDYKIPSTELYFASLLALYENRNGPQADLIGKIILVFARDFANSFMMTSTRVTYMAKNKDKIMHSYGNNPKVVVMDFCGSDGYVNSENKFEAEMEVLLGTNNCEKVEEVFKWVTGNLTYFWRINNKPNSKDERAVVFGVSNISSNFNINASEGISRPARGVVARENF